jgi:hypothetical protein
VKNEKVLPEDALSKALRGFLFPYRTFAILIFKDRRVPKFFFEFVSNFRLFSRLGLTHVARKGGR